MKSQDPVRAVGEGSAGDACFGGVPPAGRIGLRAGALSMVFEPETTMLRHIRVGGREVPLNIYSAVRDRTWGTVPAVVSDLAVRQDGSGFEVTFEANCRQGEIDFAWRGQIRGDATSVRFEMDGTARSRFWRNRLGFCVLHPLELAGLGCEVEHVDGDVEAGRFPDVISPHQPYRDIRAIRYEVAPGLSAEVRMEGDTFEMEDQRNWSDASYKTYCTPLDLPKPVEVREGTRIVQSVTVQLTGAVGDQTSKPAAERKIFTVGRAIGQLPRIGLRVGGQQGALSTTQVERLRRLNLGHLRVDVDLESAGWREVLASAARQAEAVGVPLEVAVMLGDRPREELRGLASELGMLRPAVRSVLLYRRSLPVNGQTVSAARELLAGVAAGALFGTGSNSNFTELNRNRPEVSGLDLLCYATNPQVHAFDCASMVETLRTQAVILRSARQFAGDRPVAVTPVTLRKQDRGADLRQASLFAAGWTLGNLRHLAAGGAASATYYEAAGPAGVMAAAGAGSQVVFPMYHVLADVGDVAGGVVRETVSSDPLVVEGLALEDGGRLRVLLANLTDRPVEVVVRGLPESVRVRGLDASNARPAMERPEEFREQGGEVVRTVAGEWVVMLGRCAVVRIDGEGEAS